MAAAQVVITPVFVELGARQRATSISITLSEKARGPLRLQTELLRWAQDLNGDPVTEPTDELVVTPPIAELQPGATQLFRLALRSARPASDELAYRLILEDVGEPTPGANLGPGMTINFRMRYDLPVMVAPLGKVENHLRWKPCPAVAAAPAPAASFANPRGPEACVRLLNDGNRRVKVQTLTLAGEGWQQALSLKEGENVLAGAEREWRVPLVAGQSGVTRGLQVQTARGETLQAEAGGF